MRAKTVIILSIAVAVAACAQSPESIAPVYVSDVPYLSWSCRELREEALRLNSDLATASVQQEEARSSDTVGVLLLGLPVASMSGEDVAPEIARLKGEIDAVGIATTKNNCATKPAVGQATATPTTASLSRQPGDLGKMVFGFELAPYADKDVALSNWAGYKDRYPVLETAEPRALHRKTEDGEQQYVLYGIVGDKISATDICTQIRLNDEYCRVVDSSTHDLTE